MRTDADGHDGTLQQYAAFHVLRTVASGRVHDLVTHDRGQFCFAVQFIEQAAVEGDLAAWHGPGIRHGVVDDDKFIRQRPVGNGCQALTDALHVGRQFRVDDVIAALRLPRRCIVLLANGDFLLLGNQLEFTFFGDRVDAAAGEYAADKNGI